MLITEGERHLIDRRYVHALYDRLGGDIAEESDLAQDIGAQGMLRTQDKYIGLNTDLLELLDRVLCWLGLHLACGSDIGSLPFLRS